jgi:CheY-like chemotaxis protein
MNIMNRHVHILIADDDMGHATLIRRNLKRLGLVNPVIHFKDGQEVLDFLFRKAGGPHWQEGHTYLLLLDIRMPKVDGLEVLRTIKADPELGKIPVIMITTTDDPMDIEQCHLCGCSGYMVKPVRYEKFVEVIRKLGLFFKVTEEVPGLSGPGEGQVNG